MDKNKRNEYIRDRLLEKGINTETQDYIIKYVNMNQSLFGNILDIHKVADRILNNLDHSISTYDIKSNPSRSLRKLVSSRGFWDSYEHRIETNPIHKLMSRFSKSAQQQYNSTIMHEIDHCATTDYMDVLTYFDIHEEELTAIIEREGPQETFDEVQNKQGGKLATSGISRTILGFKHNDSNLTHSILTMLNEGITAYKQEMYDKFLGIKSKTNYTAPKIVAEYISEVIGKEKLIQMHFNNDYNGIRTAFQEKTGRSLDDLVSRLKPSSSIKSKLFGKLYSRKWEKTIESFKQTTKRPKQNLPPWDLSNWGIDKKQFAQETAKISENLRKSMHPSISLQTEQKVPGDTTTIDYSR